MSTVHQNFHGTFFSRLAREELARGAVWMAEMTARLALRSDEKNREYVELVALAEHARRAATGES